MHDKIVDRLARTMRAYGDLDDIKQELRIALWKAEQKYDPSKGANLNTYLSMCGRNAQCGIIEDSKAGKRNIARDHLDRDLVDGITLYDVTPAYDSRGSMEALIDGIRDYESMSPYKRNITDRLAAGDTLADVARDEGVCKETIYMRMAKGWEPSMPRQRHPRKQEAIARVKAGESRASVAEDIGVRPVTVGRWVKAA